MRNRTLAFATLVVVLAFAMMWGSHKTVDAQPQPVPLQIEPNSFITAGKFMINKKQIGYLAKDEDGFIRIHFPGMPGYVGLSGEAAKAFLKAFSENGR